MPSRYGAEIVGHPRLGRLLGVHRIDAVRGAVMRHQARAIKEPVEAGDVEEVSSQSDAIQGTFKKEVTYPFDSREGVIGYGTR